MRSLGVICVLLQSVIATREPTIPRACTASFVHLPFCNASLSTSQRIDDLLARLSLREKALLLTARASPKGNVSSIGLPEYNWGANCVHGVQSTCGTNCATSFPNPVNLGAVFDPTAVYDMAQVIGWELRALWLEGARENYAKGPHLGLDCWSPNININRDPRWGRNMETPSEDPLINSRYGVAYTKGLQEGRDPRFLQAVVTLKHWVAYSLEHYRDMDRYHFDAVVSKYDLTDTYFAAFRASVVDGNAKGIMCSYNSVNGVPTCAHPELMQILRHDWRFDGYITSDSGAIRAIWDAHQYAPTQCGAGKVAIESGTDVNSGPEYFDCFEELVATKQLDSTYVDAAIRRTLKLRFALGLFDPIDDQPYWHVAPSEVRSPQHEALSLEITRKSLVLLENLNQTLPLSTKYKVAVLGPHANARRALLGNYLGQICHGDYQEHGCVQSPAEAIKKKIGADNVRVVEGCGLEDPSTEGFEAAAAAVRASDAVVLFLGIDTSIERESYDRERIDLPAIQLQLLQFIKRIGKPTTVVLLNGGIIGLEQVVLHCDGLVEAFYPGFYGAQAITDVLFGDYNPGGKLPVTMYRSNYVDTIPMERMSMTTFPGRSYRYFKELPVFPFGFGLSYTTFRFESLVSTEDPLVVTPALNASISIRISNTGDRQGDEVVLAFFRPLAINATGPVTQLNQQLFDYKRIEIAPTLSHTATFVVHEETLALVDPHGNLCVFPGFYQVILTNGVKERLTFAVHLVGSHRIVRPFRSMGFQPQESEEQEEQAMAVD